jgi:hypothetical protein
MTPASSLSLLHAARSAGPLPDPGAVRRTVRFSVYKSTAKLKGMPFLLSRERFNALLLSACEYCGGKGGGIDRVDNSLGYVEGNVVPCCQMCNLAKKDYTVDEFREWIDRVHAHQHRPRLALVPNIVVDSSVS